jgi:hypothetical protein
VANRYVLRMQAAFSFMEWVALLLTRSEPVGSVFEDFAAPATMAHWDRNKKRRQEKAIEVIEKLLRDEGGLRASLARHLRRALQVDEETVTDLMWQPPRAILTAVAPTILRRLKTEWRRVRLSAAEPPQDPAAGKMPLPDFVPANLFSDLNLPEVQVFAPEFQSEREFNLPIVLAITSLTPGSVTRRFSVMEAKASHWIALPDLGSSEQKMSIDSACESYEEVGVFDTMEDGVAVSVRCVRPLVMRLTRTPRNVLPSSRATPDWRSQVIPVGQGVSFGMPTGSIWLRLVRQVTFFLHNRGSAVESRRFSTGSNATVLFQSGDEFRTRVRYVNSDTAAIEALGFTELVDGVVFECTLPEQVELDGGYHDQAKMRGLRTAYFRYLTITDRELGALANRFQCDRLQETYLSALAAYALSTTGTLESAHRAFTEDLAPRAMEKVLAAVFRTLPTDWTDGEDGDQGEDFDSDDPESYQQKAHTALIKLVYDREVLKVLRRIAPVLWREPDAAFHEWVKRRLHATLGGALLAACLEVNPEAGADQLILDLDRGPRPKGEPAVATSEVWITERTMGGGGVLEEVMVHFADDPRRFFGLAESALAASDFELVDTELTRVLELLSTDKEIRNCAKGVREAGSHSELQQAIEANRRVLEARGVQVTHSVLSALHARVLRPDSGPDSDELLRVLAQHWRDMEETLGVEVDARVFSYIASRDGATIDPVLLRIDPRGDSDIVQWRLRVIHGLVWPRGHAVRAQALETYNPFAALPESDRLLLVDALNADHRPIPLSREAWRGDVAESLRFRGVAKLSCSLEQSGDLQRALLSLACVPVDVGYLQLYPQVDGIERSAAGFVATLYLPEAVQ